MAKYSSKPATVKCSAEDLFVKLSNPENLRQMLMQADESRLPEDQREMLNKMELTPDSVTIPGGPMGSITFRVVERVTPTLIALQGEGSPIPMRLEMHIQPVDASECKAHAVVDIDIPVMLKPMVSGPLQKIVDQVGGLLQHL